MLTSFVEGVVSVETILSSYQVASILPSDGGNLHHLSTLNSSTTTTTHKMSFEKEMMSLGSYQFLPLDLVLIVIRVFPFKFFGFRQENV